MSEIVFAAHTHEVYQKHMRRRMCIVAVGMLIGFAMVRIATRSSEPSADGKPLSFWLKQLDEERTETPPHNAATAAVRKIGTNALPWLLGGMRQTDSALKRKWFELVSGKPRYNSWVKSAYEHQRHAVQGYKALGAVAQPAVPDLIALLVQDSWTASEALVSIGASALPVLTNALTHSDPQMRTAIADALREYEGGGQPAIPALLERLRDTHASVRAASAYALGYLHGDRNTIAPALPPLLQDPSPNVRAATAWTAASCGDETTVDPLLKLLDDPKSAEPAIFALGAIGCRGEKVVPLLLERLGKTNAPLEDKIISCLGEFRAQHQITIPVLMRAAASSNTMNRCAAVSSLAKFKNQAELVLPVLIQRLEDPDADIRSAAADGVAEFGKLAVAAIPALMKLQTDQSLVGGGCVRSPVSYAANRAIERIQPEALRNFDSVVLPLPVEK